MLWKDNITILLYRSIWSFPAREEKKLLLIQLLLIVWAAIYYECHENGKRDGYFVERKWQLLHIATFMIIIIRVKRGLVVFIGRCIDAIVNTRNWHSKVSLPSRVMYSRQIVDGAPILLPNVVWRWSSHLFNYEEFVDSLFFFLLLFFSFVFINKTWLNKQSQTKLIRYSCHFLFSFDNKDGEHISNSAGGRHATNFGNLIKRKCCQTYSWVSNLG